MMQNMHLMTGGYRPQPEQINQALSAVTLPQYGGNYMAQGGAYPRGGAAGGHGNYQNMGNNAYNQVHNLTK